MTRSLYCLSRLLVPGLGMMTAFKGTGDPGCLGGCRRLAPIICLALFLLGTCCPVHGQVENSENRAEALFEELWKTFSEKYAFFELRGVDWNDQYRKFRPQVNGKTTEKELFEIFCKMLKPLNDGHVNLKARGSFKKTFNAETEAQFYQEFSSRKKIKLFEQAVKKTLDKLGFDEEKKRTEILIYRTSGDFGYLRVLEVEGPSTRKLNKALDEIIDAFQGKKGVVVDVRDNPGGTDKCVYTIVSRFADQKRVGHYRRTKKGPAPNEFSEKKTVYLTPYKGPTYTGPTVCLTNDASFSGADVFAMLMTSLPHVTLVGEPSNGIFSNMLEKKLKNGWRYSLSHQRYYSAEMICYEGKGVPVNIRVKNLLPEVENGIDEVLLAGIKALRSKQPSK